MLYVTKANQQFRIEDEEKDVYAAKGYKIFDAKGVEVKTEVHAPVPYEEHLKAIEAAKSVKVKDLEAKIKELEAKIAELETDDFE